MDLHLKNKVALVLAASKGLGKATAMSLSQEGANVIIGSRNAEELQKTAAEITQKTSNPVTAIKVDLLNAGQLADLIEKAGNIYGQIDILVNNSGGPPFDKFENFADDEWQAAFELNLLSFARASKQVLPFMKKSPGGRIINIISGSVKNVLRNSVLSTSMRMGIVGMAKLMADELGPYGITVNNVAPGTILTDRIRSMVPAGADPETAFKEIARNIPLGRIGEPWELAALVTFLASEQAGYITGTTIQVDGGANRAIF